MPSRTLIYFTCRPFDKDTTKPPSNSDDDDAADPRWSVVRVREPVNAGCDTDSLRYKVYLTYMSVNSIT